MFLKADTAATITIGPFVSISDGYTPVTTLAVGTVDEIGIYKDSATALTDLSGSTTLTHRAGGMYTATLASGDTNLEGRLDFYIRDDDVCLPRNTRFQVVKSNVFDGLFSQAATTTLLQVNTNQITADGTAATNLYSILTGIGADVAIDNLGITDGLDISRTAAGDTIVITNGSGDDGVVITGGNNAISFESLSARAMTGFGMDNFSDLNYLGVTRVTLTGTPSDTSLTTTFTAPAADSHKDMIAVVVTAAGPEGEARRITTNTTGANSIFTISPALSAAPSTGQEVLILGRSTT